MWTTVAIVLGLVVCTIVAIIPATLILIRERPRPYGDADDPAWWPDFEREFARYVSVRDAGR